MSLVRVHELKCPNFYTGFHFQLQRLFEQNTNSSTPVIFSEELERVPATRQLIYGN